MKRVLFFVIGLWMCCPSAYAVLHEKDLANTLSVLREELENSYKEQQKELARYETFDKIQHQQILSVIQKSNQIALMLYSQKQDYTFNITYACHEATAQYQEFSGQRMPFYSILDRLEIEIERYAKLIESLENLPPRNRPRVHVPDSLSKRWVRDSAERRARRSEFILSVEKQAERDSCVAIARNIQKSLIELRDNIKEDNEHYDRVSNRLKTLNDYAMQRYAKIQQNIFQNGDVSYLTILSQAPFYYSCALQDIEDKYVVDENSQVKSQWRGSVVVGLAFFVLIYLLIAIIVCNVFIWVFVPKRFKTEKFRKRKNYYILAGSILTFALAVMVARIFITHNFFMMASRLLVEFACLVGAILFSLLIRLKAEQIKSGFRIYTPIMLMGFLVIVFRIVFIPNSLVILLFPPILLVFTFWQWRSIKKHNQNIPKSDILYTWVSLAAMIISCVISWYGYTLLAVQIFIWWIFQLTMIQAITCAYDLMRLYEYKYLTDKLKESGHQDGKTLEQAVKSYQKHEGDYITITWFGDFVNMVVIPVLAVLSVLLCIYWAADVFDLVESCQAIFFVNFVNVVDVCQLSLFKITLVAGFYFVFRYINYMVKSVYKRVIISRNTANGQANITLANNVIAILIWGSFFIFALILLKVPKSGISIVTAGLATGVGFAMKDILENFFYGISLMTGRVRVGEYIECDGIRGKVESITYQSTQLQMADGSIIAFLNSSLFSKNFKNLTRNHGYEFVKLPVGVAYGSNIEQVRKVLTECVSKLAVVKDDGRKNMDTDKGVKVILDEFGDNSVNLYVTFWVLVEDKFSLCGMAREAMYNTLNENNIEIPFPQRDVYIKEIRQPK